MAGHLDHSPADVLAYLLQNVGLGVDPDPAGAQEQIWPIYVDNEPDLPDNCITIYNSVSRQQGRSQLDGEIQEMHGIQVRVRSSVSNQGFAKARAIAVYLDETQYTDIVTIGAAIYCAHSFTRTSGINAIGKDAPTPTKRSILTFNGLFTLTQKQIGTGTYY